MPQPATIVASGGLPITVIPDGGLPLSPVLSGGIPVTLVIQAGLAVTFVNIDANLTGTAQWQGFLMLFTKG